VHIKHWKPVKAQNIEWKASNQTAGRQHSSKHQGIPASDSTSFQFRQIVV
jgi:hypothetical protein